jgi:outer membrane autotransporter protein
MRHAAAAAIRCASAGEHEGTSGRRGCSIPRWLAGIAAVAALFPALAKAGVTDVALSVSPSSIAQGEHATFTLSVGGDIRPPATIEVALGGDAVPGADYEYTALSGPEMSSQLSESTIIVSVASGEGGTVGTATVTAIGDKSTTVTATVVGCAEDFDGDVLACPVGATAELTLTGAPDVPKEETPVEEEESATEALSLADLPGLTPNERIMASTFTDVCAGLEGRTGLSGPQQDLLKQCRVLLTTTDSGAAARGVAALTPEQAVAPRKLTNRLAGAQLDNIASRLSALRRGARGISLDELTFNVNGERVDAGTLVGLLDEAGLRGGGASADEGYQFERLGVFVNGNIDWGNKDSTRNEDGFDFDTVGLTAGIDYVFMQGLVAGIALGYGSSDVTIDASGGDLNASTWNATLYGTYYATERFYVEGSASYGWSGYNQTRNIEYSLLDAPRKAKTDFDGTQYALMVGAGSDFTRGAYIFDLYGRLNYVDADLDGYRERGANGLDLNIRDQTSTSFRSVVGGQVTRSVSLPWAVLLPQAWVEWSHEFESGDNKVSGSFAYDPSQIAFALATDRFDTDFFRLGLGLGAQFAKGRTAFISYEAALGLSDYMEQSVNLGLRLNF